MHRINNIGRTGSLPFCANTQIALSYLLEYPMKKRSSDYRRIYKNHNGEIPKDKFGRSFDIHHKDGDPSNNSIENLVAVSLQEHYDIHFSQKNYVACHAISLRLDINPEEYNKIHQLSGQQRRGIPRPDIIGDNNPMRNPLIAKKVSEYQKNKPKDLQHCNSMSISAKKRAQNKMQCLHCGKLINDVNYNRWHGNNCLQNPNNTIRANVTNFTNDNPSKRKITCNHCGIITGLGNHSRWHGNNCKKKI